MEGSAVGGAWNQFSFVSVDGGPDSDPRTDELVVREVAVDLIDRILAKVDHHINNVKQKIVRFLFCFSLCLD